MELRKGSNPETKWNQFQTNRMVMFPLESSTNQVCKNTHLLSELLPYDPQVKKGDRLKDGLNEYLLLLIASEQAMEAFENGDLKKFDPLVGENACQIRALKIALIDLYQSIQTEKLKREIRNAKSKIEELLAPLSNHSHELSLEHFLKNEGLDISLTQDEAFLVTSYILSKTKVEKPIHLHKPLVENATTDAKKIKEIRKVGTAFSWNFVRHLRESLSRSSVKFVRELSKQIECPLNLKEKVSEDFAIIHNGLECIPYYWTARVLMEHALRHRLPIVMFVEQMAKDQNYEVVNETTLYFKVGAKGYEAVSRDQLDPSQPALILLGRTCADSSQLPDSKKWLADLLEYKVEDLILAYSASHRQYPDSTKDTLVEEVQCNSYKEHKTKAFDWGCALDNPSRFFLSHAFCDKVKNG